MQVIIVISLIFSVLVAFFAVQNAGTVVINLLWYQLSLSQAVVILGSALVGVIIMLPFDVVRTIKYKLKLMELSGEVKRLKEQLKNSDLEKEANVQEKPKPALDANSTDNQ
jgi:uncharacterized integral membrane protein